MPFPLDPISSPLPLRPTRVRAAAAVLAVLAVLGVPGLAAPPPLPASEVSKAGPAERASAPAPGARRTIRLQPPRPSWPMPESLRRVLTEEGDVWVSRTGSTEVRLPDLATGHFRVREGTAEVTFRARGLLVRSAGEETRPYGPARPVAAESHGENGRALLYPQVYPGVDEELRLHPGLLKHDVILHAPPVPEKPGGPSPPQGSSQEDWLVLQWEVRLSSAGSGLVPRHQGGALGPEAWVRGRIGLAAADGRVPLALAPAVVRSAPEDPGHGSGHGGGHGGLELTAEARLSPGEEPGLYLYSIRVPLDWLAAPERAYPVRVDPTVLVRPQARDWTGFVSSNGGATYDRRTGAINSGTLLANNPLWVEVNGFSRFDTSSIPDASDVLDVDLIVWANNHDNLMTIPQDPAVPLPMRIKANAADPLGSTNQQLFDAITAGATYVSTDMPRTGSRFCRDSYREFRFDLPDQAADDLEALLAQDWFSLGFTSEIVTDPDFDHIDYIGHPEEVLGGCGFEPFPGTRITLEVVFEEENRPPLCDAGGPYRAECEGDFTDLDVDGSDSSDPDGDPLGFLWTTDCPGGEYDDPTAAMTRLELLTRNRCAVDCRALLQVDDGSLASTCQADVEIRDTTPPEIERCPEPRTLECTEPGGVPRGDPRVQEWLGEFRSRDLCTEPVETNDAPEFFPSDCPPGGGTRVRFVSTDACGASAECRSVLTVRDTSPPELTVPPPLELECDGPGGIPGDDDRIRDWLDSASAEDTCGQAEIRHDAPAFFPSGCAPGEVTTVTFTATDECGNEVTATSTVTVVDTEAPDLTPPEPLVLECDGPGGIPGDDDRIRDWLETASAEDTCGRAEVRHDAPAFFPSGCAPGEVTTVTFTATDECGNEVTATSTVTVVDTEAPDLTPPEPLVLECDGPGGIPGDDDRIRDWLETASAEDTCGQAEIRHDAPAFFPSGCAPGEVTTVTFTATDECGNEATATSTVTVADTTPPEITPPPPITLECSVPGGVPRDDPRVQDWLAAATAEDLCDGARLSNDAPALFPAGCLPGVETVVVFAAVDDCGNRATARSSVTVVDTTPPEIREVVFDGTCLWPPNHKYWCLEDLEDQVLAEDLCDPDAPEVGVQECRSSQPEEGLGDGRTFDDCVLLEGTEGFCVRSERLGNDPEGRDYTLVVFAVDGCGNRATAEATVHVPHDQSPRRECERPGKSREVE